MKSNRIIAVVGTVAVNLLIVGFLTTWTLVAQHSVTLPAIAAVHHVSGMLALL